MIKAKLSDVASRLTGKNVQALLVQSSQGLFAIPKTDLSLARKLSSSEGYNPPLVESIKKIISPQSNILVVGAHVGCVLIPLARLSKTVTAIEANPRTYELLKINMSLNGASNVTLHSFAASSDEKEVSFLASKENTGGSKLMEGIDNKFEFFYDSPDIVNISSKRLDDVFPNATFDVIVIDIEGAEAKAMKGMPSLLNKCSHLVLEILPNHLKHVGKVSPEEFFQLIPPHFSRAVVIPTLINHPEPFEQKDFLAMYKLIENSHFMDGVDAIFS